MPAINQELARAAAWDAANRQMRAAGRTRWNRDDYNLASATQARLLDYCAECCMDLPEHWPTCSEAKQ